MAVVGVHEILLKPSLSGGQRAIGKELDGMAGPVGTRAGRAMGGAIGKALKVGATAVAGGAVAGIGVALTKGFGRLRAIEQAQATLVGLGHSAQSVEQIMQNTNAAVKGTAFGLGDAATVAAQMVASGIKPGKELQNTLTLVGDAATIAGVGIGDMGSIFAKAAASNKVQMDIINQLHDAGVPALQLIATELGVTAEEASKMASAGKVDFATFEAAMTQGMGGAAQESGKTLTGAFNNSMAAIGRFGANLIQDVYPQLTAFFNGFIEWMGPVEELGKVIGSALGEGLERATAGAQGLYDLVVKGDFTGKLREAFGWEEDNAMVGMILGVRDGVEKFSRALWDAREGIGIAVAAITVLLIPAMILSATEAAKSAAAHVVAWTTKRKEAVKTAWQYQVTAYQMIGHMVAASAAMAVAAGAHALAWGKMSGSAIAHSLRIAGAWLVALGPVFWIGALVAAALAGIVALVVANWDHIVNFTRPIWEAVAGFVVAAWDAIVGAVQAGVDWVVGFATGAWDSAVSLFGTAWQSVADFMNTVWETVIKPVFDGIATAFKFVGDVLSAVYNATLKPVFEAIGAVAGWLWDHILQPFFYNVSQFAILAFDIIVFAWNNFLKPMFEELGTFLMDLWNNVISIVFGFIGTAWGGMVNGIRDLWNGVLWPVFQAVGQFLTDVWNNVISVVFGFIKAGWELLVTGIKAFWDTILMPVFQAVGDFLTMIWENVLSPVMTWISDKWKLMVEVFKLYWENVLRPIFEAVGSFLTSVWENYVQPVFQWIGDAWGGMVNGIRDLWNGVLKPVLKAFGDFVYNTVVKRIQDGVAMIIGAWNGITTGFAKTVNWVLTHVWNNGIVKAFNAVATAVDSDAKLEPAGMIALGDSSTKGNSRGQGGATTVGRRAAGGSIEGGRAYRVGELGPETIFPDRNAYVATALQTAKMMAAGQDLSPEQSKKAAGKSPREAVAPMGDFNWGAAGDELKNRLGLGSILGTDQIVNGIKFAVGGLATAAKKLMDAQMAGGSWAGQFGQLAKGAASQAVGMVADWATKQDESMAGGEYGEMFTGDAGGFHRPSRGPITSRYGRRWGSHHAGIDIAGGGPTYAAWNGVVAKTGWNIGPGRTGIGILLNHGNRHTYYGHNPVGGVKVRPGQQVKAGQRIGAQGATGNVTGTHLHFEEHRGKAWNDVNPGYLFRDKGGVLPPGLNAVLNNTGGNEWIFNQKQLGQLDRAVTGQGIDYDRLGDVLADRLDGIAVQMDGRSTIGALKSNRAWAGAS